VERTREPVVLLERDSGVSGVRLVPDLRPANVRQAVLSDELIEHVRELGHRCLRRRPRVSQVLEADVDGRAGLLGKPDYVHEGRVVLLPGRCPARVDDPVPIPVVVVEDADELRLECLDLVLDVDVLGAGRPRRDRGVEVVVELRAVADERREEHVPLARKLVLGHVDGQRAGVVGRVRLARRRLADADAQLHAARRREGERSELDEGATVCIDRHLLRVARARERRERHLGGGANVAVQLLHDRLHGDRSRRQRLQGLDLLHDEVGP
jgi:hypothetical protein